MLGPGEKLVTRWFCTTTVKLAILKEGFVNTKGNIYIYIIDNIYICLLYIFHHIYMVKNAKVV